MPKVIDAMIESMVVNISPIRQISNVIEISTADYHKLVNLRGTASGWAGETASRTATGTPSLADVKIAPSDLYAYPQATQQMLDDVQFNAEQWLADQIATEFARNEGAAFVSGTGTNQPTGFLNGTPVATADATRTFGTLQYIPTGVAGAWPASNPADFLLAMVFSLKAQYRANASWVMNKATLSAITGFKDTSGRYILTPMNQPGVPPMVFGFPVIEAEDMPTVAANSFSVAFGDFKRGYQIVDRGTTRILRDAFSNKPYVGFYACKRIGGAVVNSEAIKLAKFSVS
jgi:HK97 family phage major capsid protein